MKTCTKCGREFCIEDFQIKNLQTGRRSASCKDCHHAYLKTHYQANKATYKKRARFHTNKVWIINAKMVDDLKAIKPCIDCGKFYDPICMDYDHLPQFKKKKNISRMLSAGSSIQTILDEIAKCELVCSNCHRMRTRDRMNGPGGV